MKKSDNSRTFILILLGALTAFGPFVTDMYLPTLPSMVAYFGTTMSMVQLGLTTSMIGLALGQLFFGPLSDRTGRRCPLLGAMALFLVSTVACIFATDIVQFLACRFAQGLGAAGGIVISRSVATDKYGGHELARMLAVIGAINGIAPVAAPIVGGSLTDVIGWRGIFMVLLVVGVVLTAGSAAMHESLPLERRTHASWSMVFTNFGKVLSNREFVFFVLQMAVAQGILFGNIASSPFIVQEHYGYSALAFSVIFGVNSIAIGVGSAMSIRFRHSATASLLSCLGMVTISLLLCLALYNNVNFWLYESLTFVLLFVMGLTFTATTTLAMNAERRRAGTASALLGATCFIIGGAVSPIVGIGNIMHSTGIVFVVSSLLSLLCILVALGHRRTRLYLRR